MDSPYFDLSLVYSHIQKMVDNFQDLEEFLKLIDRKVVLMIIAEQRAHFSSSFKQFLYILCINSRMNFQSSMESPHIKGSSQGQESNPFEQKKSSLSFLIKAHLDQLAKINFDRDLVPQLNFASDKMQWETSLESWLALSMAQKVNILISQNDQEWYQGQLLYLVIQMFASSQNQHENLIQELNKLIMNDINRLVEIIIINKHYYEQHVLKEGNHQILLQKYSKYKAFLTLKIEKIKEKLKNFTA